MNSQFLSLVDVGVNLAGSKLSDSAAHIIAEAAAVGVQRQVVIGTSVLVSQQAVALASQYSNCIATVGVHPHDAANVGPHYVAELRELAQQAKVRAIGECGLDYNRNYSPPAVQRKVFAEQLALAAELNMPVYLHERDALGDQLTILDQYRASLPAVVVHCFTGDQAALAEYQARDCYIGITGWVCDERRGLALQQAVKDVRPERLLLETDAPYLLPRTIRPRPKSGTNVPAHLPWVLNHVALLRGESPALLAKQTTTNALRVFGDWPAFEHTHG